MSALMRLPVNPLLNVVPIERYTIVANREIKHRFNLICFRQLRMGVVTLYFTQHDSMLEQLVNVVRFEAPNRNVKNGQVGTKTVTSRVTKSLDYRLNADVFARIATLYQISD